MQKVPKPERVNIPPSGRAALSLVWSVCWSYSVGKMVLVLLFGPPYPAILAPAFDRRETSVNVTKLILLVIPGWELLLPGAVSATMARQ